MKRWLKLSLVLELCCLWYRCSCRQEVTLEGKGYCNEFNQAGALMALVSNSAYSQPSV